MAPRFLNAYSDWYVGGVLRARLNDRPRADGYPHTAVKRVGGARSIPDADDVEVDIPAGRLGETPYPRTTRGKTLTYELRARALTEPDFVTHVDNLNAVFADVSSVGLLVVTPWPGHGSDIWATFARVADYDDDEQLADPHAVAWPDTEWMHDPILVLRMLDGRWLYWNESGTPGTAMSWTSNPGSAVLVTNSGNAPVEPVVTVFGVAAGTDLHIARDIAGGGTYELWFRNPVAAAGLTGTHDVVVDFPARKVSVGGSEALGSYDAAASNWWDEYVEGIPGTPSATSPVPVNVWRGPGAGVGIEVHFFSGSW